MNTKFNIKFLLAVLVFCSSFFAQNTKPRFIELPLDKGVSLNLTYDMIQDSKQEGQKSAERSFTFANEVEKVHASLYQKALNNLESLEEVDYYVCSVCGYTCESEPPEKCPVCGAKSTAFFKTA